MGHGKLALNWVPILVLVLMVASISSVESSRKCLQVGTSTTSENRKTQVVGKKYIRLYCASLSEELYPYSETMLCNSSQVDLDNIDEKEFPEVQDLEFLDCILEEGDMLYIPPKWWLYVRF